MLLQFVLHVKIFKKELWNQFDFLAVLFIEFYLVVVLWFVTFLLENTVDVFFMYNHYVNNN